MQVVQSAALPPVVDGFGERYEQFLPIVEVRESERNARKYFDAKKLAELTESIRQHGVIQPVLVRDMPHSGVARYELIDGARRLRAAIAAGLRDLPARVLVDCGDREALELGAVANLQRDDIHPLDEALAYRALIEASGAEVATVAARVGKSESYVYQRLKLTDLCEQGRKLLWADEISIGVALLLAKVAEEHQKAAIHMDWPLRAVRDLENWLDSNVYLELGAAPWDRSDAALVPEAGSCVACPKRTGFIPALFPELEGGDNCTDPKCFNRKKSVFVQLKKAELAEREPDTIVVSGEWRYGDKSDVLDRSRYRVLDEDAAADNPDAKKALVVDGQDAGHVIYIAPNRSTGFNDKPDTSKANAKAAKLEEKIKAETITRSVASVLEAVSLSHYTDRAEWRFIVGRIWERTWSDLRRKIISRRKLPGETAADRVRAMDDWIEQASGVDLTELLWELAMGGHSDYSEEAIQQAAKLASVDLDAVAQEVRAELENGKAKPKKEAAPPVPVTPPPLPAAARKRVEQAKKKLAAKKAVKKVPPPVKKKAAKKVARKKRA